MFNGLYDKRHSRKFRNNIDCNNMIYKYKPRIEINFGTISDSLTFF